MPDANKKVLDVVNVEVQVHIEREGFKCSQLIAKYSCVERYLVPHRGRKRSQSKQNRSIVGDKCEQVLLSPAVGQKYHFLQPGNHNFIFLFHLPQDARPTCRIPMD